MRRAVALLASCVAAASLSAMSPAASAAQMSRADARAFALGYLWSDGHHVHDGSGVLSMHQRVLVAQFTLAARIAGGDVHTGRNPRNGRYVARVRHLPLDVNLRGTPPALRTATDRQVKAFLAAVLQCEAQRGGQVLDDPHLSRILAAQRLLARVGIRSHYWHGRIYHLVAERADWHKFNSFPVLLWDRVPGH